jgi:lipopolysaccharide biosynthesis glycosyltransferase
MICDDNYLKYCAFLVNSLVRKNEQLPEIYILTDGVNNESFESEMNQFVGVTQIELDLNSIRSFGAASQGHVSISTYGKLLLAEVIPLHITKCVYLDIDVYINGNLKPLFDFQLNRPIAGTQFANGESRQLFGNDNHTYFSAGILLADLTLWRSKNVTEGLIQALNRLPQMRYQDADILNIYFKDNWQPLPISFNFMAEVALNAHLYDSKIKPLIVHFPGANKPWTPKGHTAWHRLWRYEYNKFSGVHLEKIGSDSIVNGAVIRIGKTKIGAKLKQIIPRRLKDRYLIFQERLVD